MTCSSYSESGAPIAPTRCAEYNALKYDRDGWRNSFDRLFLHCKEKDEDNARLLEALNNIYCLCAEGPDALGGSLLALAAIETEARNALKEVG